MRASTTLPLIALFFLLCVLPFAANAQEPSYVITIPGPGAELSYPLGNDKEIIADDHPVDSSVSVLLKPTYETVTVFDTLMEIPMGKALLIDHPGRTEYTSNTTMDHDVALNENSLIRFKWQQSGTTNIPSIKLKAVFADEDGTHEVEGYYAPTKLKTLQEYPLKEALFERKQYSYLLKRELGIGETSKAWQTAMDRGSKRTVIQRRIDLPAAEVTTVRLTHSPKILPGSVHFSIDADGDGDRDLFLFDNPNVRSSYRDGQVAVLEIDFIKLANQVNLDTSKAIILEPIIFLNEDLPMVKEGMTLHSIAMLGHDLPESTYFKPTFRRSGETCVLDFRLHDNSQESSVRLEEIKRISLHSLSITIAAKGPDIFRWSPVQIGSIKSQRITSLAMQPSRTLEQFGVPRSNSFIPGSYDLLARLAQWESADGTQQRLHWLAKNTRRQGTLFTGFDTAHKVSTPAWIEYVDKKEDGTALIVSSPTGHNVMGEIPATASIKGIRSSVRELTVNLFDVKPLEQITHPSQITWWQADASVPLFPDSIENTYWDKEHNTLHLFAKNPGKQSWVIPLSASPVSYFAPVKIVFPDSLPDHVSIAAVMGDKRYPTGTTNEITLNGVSGPIDSLNLEVVYDGPVRSIPFTIPRLLYAGVKRTAHDPLDNFKIIMGKRHIPLASVMPTTPEGLHTPPMPIKIPVGRSAVEVRLDTPLADISQIAFRGAFDLPDTPKPPPSRSVWWSLALMVVILAIVFSGAALFLRNLSRCCGSIWRLSLSFDNTMTRGKVIPIWIIISLGSALLAYRFLDNHTLFISLYNLASLSAVIVLLWVVRSVRSILANKTAMPHRANDLSNDLILVGLVSLALLTASSSLQLPHSSTPLSFITYVAFIMGIVVKASQSVAAAALLQKKGSPSATNQT